MKKPLLATAIVAALATAPVAQSAELRIGFINTLTGGAAIIGKHQVNGWNLGLAHEGWNKNGDKLGGVPTKIWIADDARKPDVGRRAATKMMRSNKVHIVAGMIWSNILAAVSRPVTRNKTILMSTNAGWAGLAGRKCSRYFISSSWNNDQTPEAMGRLMREEGLKSVYLLSPNYQAGKDMLAGFKRFYRGGKVVGTTLFKLGQRDYQADISKIRAAKPQALFVFAPGGMGIAFMKQWAASGAGKSIRLYTVFTVDNLTINPIGNAALGSFHTNYWDPDSKNAANQKFIKSYVARHKRLPSHFAAQAYDAPRLIAAAVRKVGGRVDNKLALVKAMRKVKYDSIRGPYRYNVNGIPIQNFYKRAVVPGPAGKAIIRTQGIVFSDHKDAYWRKCPARERH